MTWQSPLLPMCAALPWLSFAGTRSCHLLTGHLLSILPVKVSH